MLMVVVLSHHTNIVFWRVLQLILRIIAEGFWIFICIRILIFGVILGM